jgi:hypothetical protein
MNIGRQSGSRRERRDERGFPSSIIRSHHILNVENPGSRSKHVINTSSNVGNLAILSTTTQKPYFSHRVQDELYTKT